VSGHDPRPTGIVVGLYLTASAVTAVVAVSVAGRRGSTRPSHETTPQVVALRTAPGEPIEAEAQVFHTTPAILAIDPAGPRDRTAHPRTLATYRFLRGYPGAPPRIPHPLTAAELRTGACETCHDRGGYSRRFAAYVPITPHPGWGMCTQCHVGVDSVVGLATLADDPSARCQMCHGPDGGPARADASVTWATTVWPSLPPAVPDQRPPPVPHDLQLRGNCLACHTGPAAVAQIRTTHPLRADCRQCHVVAVPGGEAFTRPAGDGPLDKGGP